MISTDPKEAFAGPSCSEFLAERGLELPKIGDPTGEAELKLIRWLEGLRVYLDANIQRPTIYK